MHVKRYANVKVLAVSQAEGSEPVALTARERRQSALPADPDAYIYVDKVPGRQLDPIVREFLRFCLSRKGRKRLPKQATTTRSHVNTSMSN